MDKGSPLALDAAAYGEAKGLRRGEDIIDSLAYIDTLSEAEKLAAENLIKDEVKAMGKRPADYLKELPKIHQVKFEGHPVLQAEWERMKTDQPMAEPDKLRYKCLPPPENRRNDVSAWHTSLNNAHSQLEHQYNRLEQDAGDTVQQVGEVNKRRKLEHEAAGTELEAIESEWKALLLKNREIDTACGLAEKQIASLEEQLSLQGGSETLKAK